MDKTIRRSRAEGSVTAPSSKSYAQRAVAAALLCEGTSTLTNMILCDDTRAALQVAADLGAEVEAGTDGTTYTVRGGLRPHAQAIHIGESGLAARLFTPIAALCGERITITGRGSILRRPLAMMEKPLRTLGAKVTSEGGYLPIRIEGPLHGGAVSVDGSLSSQFITGLLMALPGLAADSELVLTGPLASRPYVDLTLAVLRRCGVHIGQTDCGFTIPGGQRFRTVPLDPEPDWSAAAFWLAVRTLGCAVAVTGLRRDSLQGDRAAAALCRCLPEEVDLTDIPDLLPPLALLAALRPGTETRFTGAARLRDKESDRLASVSAALTALGGRVRQEPEGLTVWGVERLSGGEADSCGDHRIAMLCACAAPFCTGPVVLRNAGCTAKSYPGFWADYHRLGGQFEVL